MPTLAVGSPVWGIRLSETVLARGCPVDERDGRSAVIPSRARRDWLPEAGFTWFLVQARILGTNRVWQPRNWPANRRAPEDSGAVRRRAERLPGMTVHATGVACIVAGRGRATPIRPLAYPRATLGYRAP